MQGLHVRTAWLVVMQCGELGLCGHRVDGDDGVEIHPPKAAGGKGYLATLQSLLQQVPSVIVQGIPTVERAVVEKKTKEDGRSVSRASACAACCMSRAALRSFCCANQFTQSLEAQSRVVPFVLPCALLSLKHSQLCLAACVQTYLADCACPGLVTWCLRYACLHSSNKTGAGHNAQGAHPYCMHHVTTSMMP